MRKVLLLFIALLAFSCSKDQPDLIVRTSIKGLKKGTVYLKKVKDTSLITIDSAVINGNSMFELKSDLESPEVFYLYLDKNGGKNDRITFFADKGVTEINTTLKNFVFDANIKGSEQQKVLEDYQLLMSRINHRNLDLIKESFDAQKNGDSLAFVDYEKKQNNIIKSKYLQTVNFAINNSDSEVAPYLALTEIYNAKINFLDTINKSLTPKVKASKYGKELDAFIKEIKAKEN
ncbi:DUF4369 domain-containing protein [Aestuariivivens sp. NBU2969]|uniref:DUF4369 domain-containing protein n=1 Tax=Aestuariivivens sp. NBU2969 TaxID=2873267 RepID=UPI001CBF3DA1|nr:DUF4369 domain-containing protein [Aestuariivivens sp. NBU2969]